MDPVLSRVIIEGEEHVLVFHEAVAGLLEFCLIKGVEGIVGNQRPFFGAMYISWIFSLALAWTLLGLLSRMFVVL